MTIMMVSGSYPPMVCGVGDYTAKLAQEIARLQPRPVVVLTGTGGSTGDTKGLGVKVHRSMPDWSLSELATLVKIILSEKPDVVHFQYPTAGYRKGLTPWLAPLVAGLMGFKVVQTWHEGYNLRQTPTMLLKAIAPGRLIVVRPNYADFIRPWLKWILPLKKCTYIASASTIPKAMLTSQEAQQHRKSFPEGKKLLVFFGFVHRDKGVHRIFDFADPEIHHIIVVGPTSKSDEYCRDIQARCISSQWKDSSEMMGHLREGEVADLLSIADAVVLPFEKGGGKWNTSIEAARINGTFVLTTSLTETGYSSQEDVYYAQPGNVSEMKTALARRLADGYKPDNSQYETNPWRRIAKEHLHIYNSLLPLERRFPELTGSDINND